MNTPAHLIFATAAFGHPHDRAITTAAILGALAPDMSLYLMASWSIFVAGIDPETVFRSYYYSSEWQRVFAVDNSFVFWGVGLGFAMWGRSQIFIAFAGAGLLHLAFDLPVHNHDARMHFWPLTDWKFISPISYWDNRFHATFVSRVELAAALILVVALLARFRRWPGRVLILCVALLELMATGVFRWLL